MRIQRVGQANNFDFLRLALSILVIVSHSYALGTGSEAREPLLLWTHGQLTFGALAVDCFFIMSGLLIAGSAQRSPNLKGFFKKRVTRIYPGFLACAVLTVLVLRPLASAILIPHTVALRIVDVAEQSLRLREFHYTHAFAGNPFPGVMNGSIWSIQYEFWCYIGVALLLALGLLRWRITTLMLLLVSVAWSVVSQVQQWQFQGDGNWLISAFGLPQFWARLAPLYLAGVVFYLYRDHIEFRLSLALSAFAALVLASFWHLGWTLVLPFAGPYLLFYVAYVPQSRLQRFGRFGDLSYGTYLYAFPVQQLLMHIAGHTINPWRLFAMATPVTLLLAAGSWYGVERHFMRPGRQKELPLHDLHKGDSAATQAAPHVTSKVDVAPSA